MIHRSRLYYPCTFSASYLKIKVERIRKIIVLPLAFHPYLLMHTYKVLDHIPTSEIAGSRCVRLQLDQLNGLQSATESLLILFILSLSLKCKVVGSVIKV